MNVVLNFHKGDQHSAKLMLELLKSTKEGTDVTYYLQYGDPLSTLEISKRIVDFLEVKKGFFSSEMPKIKIPVDMVNNDPNRKKYKGNHTNRNLAQKFQILGWNLCVFKYIQKLDKFLMIEPDCLVLKNGWLKDIEEASSKSNNPIFGHLKKGKISNKYVPTHWAGCSVYFGEQLRHLDLERYFYERYPNPWWPYRDLSGTETASNCFWGPAFSGFDISYDYFLFGLHWKNETGENDPFSWPLSDIEDRKDLIFCDFKSKKRYNEIEGNYLEKTPMMHGFKDDQFRVNLIKHFKTNKVALNTKLPLSLKNRNILNENNSCIFSFLDELKDKFKGERCFIIGNGPSLNKTDLKKLRNEFTFGLNRIYLNYDRMGYQPTFFCCVNSNVIEQFSEEIDRLNSIKFIADFNEKSIKNRWNTFLMGKCQGGFGFNENLETMCWFEGWTVTFCAMQIAFYLGFDKVYLVGVDHYFKKAGDANKLVTEDDDDVNHFHPSYFGKGINWQYPDLEKSEKSYRIAKEVFESCGRNIYDATIGGNLKIFNKVVYDRLFECKYEGQHENDSEVKKPKVSIVMPCYQAERTILESVQSILAQDYRDWELLIVEEKDSDFEYETVSSVINCDDRRIRILPKKRGGVSSARNIGILESKGEYLAFLDADDIYYPSSLGLRIRAIEEKGYDAVFCECKMLGENLEDLNWKVSSGNRYVTFMDMANCPFHIASVIVKKEIVIKNQIFFDEGLCNGEDWDFFQRLARTGLVFWNVGVARIGYRQHSRGTVLGKYRRHIEGLKPVLEKIYGHDPRVSKPKIEYEQGLGEALKTYAACKKMFSLMIWELLNNNAKGFQEAFYETSPTMMFNLNKNDIVNTFKSTIQRNYRCRSQEWEKHFVDNISNLKKNMKEVMPFDKYPRIELVFNTIENSKIKTPINLANPMKIKSLERELESVYNSYSWKFGRSITKRIEKYLWWIPPIRNRIIESKK